MPAFEFYVSMDGKKYTREIVEAGDVAEAADILDAREPSPRWFALAKALPATTARRLSDLVAKKGA